MTKDENYLRVEAIVVTTIKNLADVVGVTNVMRITSSASSSADVGLNSILHLLIFVNVILSM